MKIMPIFQNTNKQVSFTGDATKIVKKPFYSSIVKMYDEALDVFQKAENKKEKGFATCQLGEIFDTKILVSPQIRDKNGNRFWIENIIPGKGDFGTSQLVIYNIIKNVKGAQEVKYTSLLANPDVNAAIGKKLNNDSFLILNGIEGSSEKGQQFWLTKNDDKYSDNLKEILNDIKAKLRKFLSVNSDN